MHFACIATAVHNTVISAPFSLGSHPQNLPQLMSAHIPPSIVPPNVNINAKHNTAYTVFAVSPVSAPKFPRAAEQIPRAAQPAEVPLVHRTRVRLHAATGKKALKTGEHEGRFGNLAPLVFPPNAVVDGFEFVIAGGKRRKPRIFHRRAETLARRADKIQDGLVRIQQKISFHAVFPR